MISKANTDARSGGPRLPRRPIVRRLSRETRDEQADWATVPEPDAALLGGDAKTQDPAPLGDATVTDESELFEQALWPGMQVGATLRVTSIHLLGVGLDQASASMRYRSQHRGNSGPRHAFPPASRARHHPPHTPTHQPRSTPFQHPRALPLSPP